MKRSSSVVFLFACCALVATRAADATSPVDYTDRNARFKTGDQVKPETNRPKVVDDVQQRRVEPARIEKQPAAVGERRASIDLAETRDKVVHEKNVRPPDKIEVEKSRYDQQRSRFSTANDTKKPPTVTRYQESLTAASATNMARFPAMSTATTAKINRFVFRKNAGEPSNAAQGAKVVPAAGK